VSVRSQGNFKRTSRAENRAFRGFDAGKARSIRRMKDRDGFIVAAHGMPSHGKEYPI